MLEAMDPLQTDPTSIPYICKVFENLHMLSKKKREKRKRMTFYVGLRILNV